MKIYNESVLIPSGQTINIKYLQSKKFDAPYHNHPEYELTYIISGNGTRFIGGQKSEFQPGDFVLIGPGIPHAWFSDDSSSESEAIVLQWNKEKIKGIIHGIPEWKVLEELLDQANLGIRFQPDQIILQKLYKLIHETPEFRLITFLKILLTLSHQLHSARQILKEYISPSSYKNCDRMAIVLEYISEKIFTEEISVQKISSKLHMTPSSFCHFFKKRTQKTFIKYINEIRLSKSVGLLLRSEENISVIAFQSGFQNLSHFNRQFKKRYKISPRLYREQSNTIILANEVI